MTINGIRDSKAFKHMMVFVPATGYGTEKCREVMLKTARALPKEKLGEMLVDTLLWLKRFYADFTHMDIREYGLNWRIDKNKPEMIMLKAIVTDVLGKRKDNDVYHEVKDERDKMYKLLKEFGW